MSEIYRIEFVPQFLQIQESIFSKDPVVLSKGSEGLSKGAVGLSTDLNNSKNFDATSGCTFSFVFTPSSDTSRTRID